jgi:hypothetical protein
MAIHLDCDRCGQDEDFKYCDKCSMWVCEHCWDENHQCCVDCRPGPAEGE